MIYIVTYDLCKEESSLGYQRLIELIKGEVDWACLGGSSYLIESYETAVQLRDKYVAVLDKDDKLYVGEVSAPAAWFGYSEDVSNWILDKLEN